MRCHIPADTKKASAGIAKMKQRIKVIIRRLINLKYSIMPMPYSSNCYSLARVIFETLATAIYGREKTHE